jgi:hypothetical protein
MYSLFASARLVRASQCSLLTRYPISSPSQACEDHKIENQVAPSPYAIFPIHLIQYRSGNACPPPQGRSMQCICSKHKNAKSPCWAIHPIIKCKLSKCTQSHLETTIFPNQDSFKAIAEANRAEALICVVGRRLMLMIRWSVAAKKKRKTWSRPQGGCPMKKEIYT